MILDRPAPFDEALRSLAVKAALPNDLTSAELQQAADVIGGRAVVIAGATNARFADDVRREAMRYLTPQAAPGQGVSLAGSRIALRQSLDRMRYRAPEGGEGGIRDLASEQRLNLVVETQVRMADGYGQFERGQRTAIRYLWPAWELVRKMARLEPRDWPTVWSENGGSFYPGAGPYAEGRMIARKDDPIWTAISRFGLPYPPFDFNSGMGLEGVRRDVCERFGIIRRGQQVEVTSAPFEEGATMPLEISPELQAAVIDRVGPDYEFRDGVLRHVANEFAESKHPRDKSGRWSKKDEGSGVVISSPVALDEFEQAEVAGVLEQFPTAAGHGVTVHLDDASADLGKVHAGGKTFNKGGQYDPEKKRVSGHPTIHVLSHEMGHAEMDFGLQARGDAVEDYSKGLREAAVAAGKDPDKADPFDNRERNFVKPDGSFSSPMGPGQRIHNALIEFDRSVKTADAHPSGYSRSWMKENIFDGPAPFRHAMTTESGYHTFPPLTEAYAEFSRGHVFSNLQDAGSIPEGGEDGRFQRMGNAGSRDAFLTLRKEIQSAA
jgi:hypothetical protein